MADTKNYPHVTGIHGDGGENEGALAVTALLDPGSDLPECARIIVGSPQRTPTIEGYIPDLGGFSCGPDAAERLIATLQQAVRDVREAMGQEAPTSKDQIPALWFELALQLHPFAAEMDGRIPESLGLRVRVDGTGPSALVYGTASGLVDSGFMLHREQVAELHQQLGAWLSSTAPEAGTP